MEDDMADLYPIQLPVITSAVISPAVVSAGQQYTIAVQVEIETKYLEPEVWYSGELYSNEV